ncbi:FG-GAP repeat domain-containing protein [Paenibacillus contaminans]|uniref:VCBS repeat-containing protein n=1 Tax=Paenibacillus contaminans TaxID=450362 RepID=A0A329LSP4_9BACL|nr:VCBS repeat-containing protein [Paenibacillus contaminans]RAV10789.1 VCBS repeat-containing protein [Paenibacillus contaminans]
MNKLRSTLLAAAGALLLLVAALFFVPKEDRLDLLYATSADAFDASAYDNLHQTLSANAYITRTALDGMSERKLRGYDAIYLDPGLQHTDVLRQALPKLTGYVRAGGHLFLENGFAADFPLDMLGASALSDIPDETSGTNFDYPAVDVHLQGMQQVFQLFADNFGAHGGFNALPGFLWGKGIVPTTAETVVKVNGVSAMTVNRFGEGSVLLAGTFLPNRYFITGFDLQSGYDAAQGFSQLAAEQEKNHPRRPGTTYFDFKNPLPLQPYFQFSFAAANYQLRNAYVSYVSKEKLGYSVTKVLGPYGRPAMAFQNHFEALPGFRDGSGIIWAELLKEYNEIPSYSLVRGSFEWNKWWENAIVHLNAGTAQQPKFIGEFANSFYSSGVKLASGSRPIKQAPYSAPNDLSSPMTDPYRMYPAFVDLDGDGTADLLAASADGFIYAYRNLGAKDDAYASQPLPEGLAAPDAFGPPEKLLQANGKPLSIGEFGTLAAADLNGDGRADLVLGNGAGELYVSLALGGAEAAAAASAPGKQNGFVKAVYAAPQRLMADGKPLAVTANAAPAIGDIDGDGTPDLLVGDSRGAVTLFRGVPGRPLDFERGIAIAQLSAPYAAPALADMNGDGKLELLVGSSDGDVMLFEQRNGSWLNQGPIAGETKNMLGSHALVGGHYSVPVVHDVNRDGKPDLVVGQIGFSDPVTVDDPNFPYAAGLKEFIDYTKTNKIPLYPHVYVHHYVSDEQEKAELALQRESFKKLGIPWVMPGTNQHTWRINNSDRLQTLRNEHEQDIWFNFGFRPSNNRIDPTYTPDYIWGMPFLLADGSLKNPMVVGAPAVRFAETVSKEGVIAVQGTEDIYRSYTALDMPIDYFEHIEYAAADPLRLKNELLPFVKYMDKLRTEYDYNFMTEPQMAQSYLTALTSKVKVSQSWGLYFLDKLKNLAGKGEHLTLTLTPQTGSVPAQAGDYRNALGVAIEPGKRYANHPLVVDSPVYTSRDAFQRETPAEGDKQMLYAGLTGPTKLSVSWRKEPFHIVRVNVPMTIDKQDKGWTIALNGEGMQQIKLYSPPDQPLAIEGDNLKIEENPERHTYTVTHYGDKTTIRVKPQ